MILANRGGQVEARNMTDREPPSQRTYFEVNRSAAN